MEVERVFTEGFSGSCRVWNYCDLLDIHRRHTSIAISDSGDMMAIGLREENIGAVCEFSAKTVAKMFLSGTSGPRHRILRPVSLAAPD